MPKSNKIVITFGVLFSIIVLVVAYYRYQANIDMLIVTPKGSYAEKYAKKHLLEIENVSTNEKIKYSKNLEEFEYLEKNNEITITEYNGISTELVIPSYIKNKKVTGINNSILNNTKIQAIVISNNIKNVDDKEQFKKINIKCYYGNYCNELKETEGMNVTIMNNSEYVDFNNSTDLYAYELKNNEIELIRYDGSSDIAIIPNKINGYNVTKINCDSKNIIGIYIPETVKNIGSNFISKYLNRVYLTTLIVTTISLMVFIVINMFIKSKSLEETSSKSILSIIGILYILVIGYFSYSIKDLFVGYKLYIIKFFIATAIYVFISIALLLALKNNNKYAEGIKNKKAFIKEATLLLEDIDSKDEYNIKDLIRYSDPISIPEVNDIEKQILELISNLNKSNSEEIKKLIKKRNNIIKQNK